MEFFDTHAHYDDRAFDEDREEMLAGLLRGGVARVVNIGASLASCRRTLNLMEQYDFIYGALGVHPSDCGEMKEEDIAWLREQCGHEKCVAVGEIGLDYYHDRAERSVQKKWFVNQMDLARELKLPIVVHSRDAAQDTVDIMKQERACEIGGVIHCFSYTKESAREFLDMGFYFGIGGVVTFSNARKLKEAVEYLPMDRIVLETDSPYLAPEPYRGKRNNSCYLSHVADVVAQLKGMQEEELRRIVWQNGLDLYRMEN